MEVGTNIYKLLKVEDDSRLKHKAIKLNKLLT